VIVWSPSALARAGLTVEEAETLALSATPAAVPDPAAAPVPAVVTPVQPASIAAEVERYLAMYEEQRPT
jgi:hypothetical protein